MSLTVDDFLENLITSRLMSEGEARAFLLALPARKQPADGETFGRLLVKHSKLTLYQARAIFQGRPHGLVLGDYEILEKIGQGGMGQVFKARHHRMDRVVALKVLPANVVSQPDVIQRFLREMKAAAKLSHPNIVTAYDARADGTAYYLVLEFVDGVNLYELVHRKGPLTVDQAVDYVSQAAAGLQHAHEQGVIHRDIKPGNMLLDKQETIKILDMGLARLHEEPSATLNGSAELTRVGRIMGTVDYMSPEQTFDSSSADEMSDIYSLGCTLFYLLTKRNLYIGESVLEKVMAHREAPLPSLRKVRGDVPAHVDAVFQRMVAKRPEDRFASMAEVIAGLNGRSETSGTGKVAGQSKPAPRTDKLLPQHVLSAILAE